MTDISRTEKVPLHTPALEELRGGEDFSFNTYANCMDVQMWE